MTCGPGSTWGTSNRLHLANVYQFGGETAKWWCSRNVSMIVGAAYIMTHGKCWRWHSREGYTQGNKTGGKWVQYDAWHFVLVHDDSSRSICREGYTQETNIQHRHFLSTAHHTAHNTNQRSISSFKRTSPQRSSINTADRPRLLSVRISTPSPPLFCSLKARLLRYKVCHAQWPTKKMCGIYKIPRECFVFTSRN